MTKWRQRTRGKLPASERNEGRSVRPPGLSRGSGTWMISWTIALTSPLLAALPSEMLGRIS